MTFAVLLQALLTYGPQIIPLVQKLVADIEAGKANSAVTSADISALIALASQNAEDIFKRAGVTPPSVQ